MIKGSVKLAPLIAQLRAVPGALERESDKALRNEARVLVSSSGRVPGLVQVTPPHHAGVRGSKAKATGEAAVQRDIYRVYATPGMLYRMIRDIAGAARAKEYWYILTQKPEELDDWIKNEAPSRVRGMFVGWDNGAEHLARRRFGRVVGKLPSRRLAVNESRKLKQYIAKVKRRVGMLAAAPATAVGSKYGKLSGVPAWVSRQRSRWGVASERRTARGLVIVLGTAAPFVVRDLQRRFTYVVQYRVKALERQTPYIIRAAAKKAGFLVQ